jgi:type IV pilus assembly protein PilY1
MKRYLNNNSIVRPPLLSLALAVSLVFPLPTLAASLSLATAPLARSTTSAVKPNLLFVLDDSGSMGWEYMPDAVNNNESMACYRNSYYNGVYYNPNITYQLPVYSSKLSYPNSSFTAAKTNGFSGTTTVNLSTSFRTGSDGSDQAAYYYKYTGANPVSPVRGTCYPDASYTRVTVSSTSGPGGTDERQNFANWYTYYRTRMLTMKSAAGLAFSNLTDAYRVGLMKINSSSSPTVAIGSFDVTRSSWYDALYAATPNNSTPLREALANAGRYYAGKLVGTDPVQYSCQQNFTILSTDGYWNGNAGVDLNGNAVGNQDGTANAPMWDGAQTGTTVTTTYTRNTYTEQRDPIPGTNPTGERCSRGFSRIIIIPETRSCSTTNNVTTCTAPAQGNMAYESPYTYARSSCVNSGNISAPNSSNWVAIGTPVTTEGSSGGTSDTLADVAMYYYQTDLRTAALGNCTGSVSGENVCENNVFTTANDNNIQQHMTTFTLGLGANGRMRYSSSYLTDTSGDFYDLRTKNTASANVCAWQTAGTTCTWPIPGSGSVANIDDLWHAAVNGRGAYFSADDPTTLSSGLSSALAGIKARKGAAAAAATSTLNPVAGNNFAFVASYTTVAWKGNLEARGINTETGVVAENATWCVENVPEGACASPGTIVAEISGDVTIYNCVTPGSFVCTNGTLVGTDCKVPVPTACTGTMNTRVAGASDTRTVKTVNSTGTALVDFTHANLTASQQAYFGATSLAGLSQWASLTDTQKAAAAGENLINYLRGQYGYEDRNTNPVDNRLYRFREAVLGDALESQPAFIGSPVFNYPYPGYASYKSAQASRAGTVFMGANDGMMHAFATDTGVERWAYVPSMVIPNMWKLADKNYATQHVNFVNGSPITSDVCTANCTDAASAVWKTILVAGLNGGGRGYYALDITTPDTPALLWEFTPTGGMGSVTDDDVGYTFGQAIMTTLSDGTWVVLVTSGYNNTNPGNGMGYLYVLNAATGAVIRKIGTGVGDTTTPSGLARIAAWNNAPAGNKAGYVYGGDLLGNLWRFDINTGAVLKFAELFSDAGGTSPQPITTAPALGNVNGKRVVYIGTGKYLETADLTTTQRQSQYAILDDDATSTLVNPRTVLRQVTLVNAIGTNTRSSTGSGDSFSGLGWYADFPDNGERVNIEASLVQGILVVPSIVPSNTACNPGGYGWLNYFDYLTGSVTAVKFDATIVGINILYIQGKPIVEAVTSTNPTPEKPNIQPTFHATSGGFSSHRTLWREMIP